MSPSREPNEQGYIFHPASSQSQISETISGQDLLNEEKMSEIVKNDNVTCWRSVKIVGLLSFLGMLEGGLISMGEWPYMHQVR